MKHATEHIEQDSVLLDGSRGEGGGQILRTSLALSTITGTPISLERIRAKRKNPGLRRQHQTCVDAAAQISGADVSGAAIGSRELHFAPKGIVPGDYRFDIGTAGSTTLVLQTVLPPLLCANGPSRVVIEGGTHNPMAPPVEFLQRVFLPQLAAMGGQATLTVEQAGFYPAGGGRIVAEISPVRAWKPYAMMETGAAMSTTATAKLSKLPEHIAERELAVIQRKLRLSENDLFIEEVKAKGPGNVVQIALDHENMTELITGFGEKAVSAEKVATGAAREVQAYRRSEAPVGEHLADQLLLPLAIGAGGTFRTGPITEHTRTNMQTIQEFIDVSMTKHQISTHTWEIKVMPRKKEGV